MGQVAEAVLQRQRTIQTVLVAVILLALSLYCCGGVLLLVGPGRSHTTPTAYPTVTAFPNGVTVTPYPSITPFNLPSAQPLLPTPTQLYLAPQVTQTYVQFATNTPFATVFPTFVLPSSTAIIIIPRTSTSPATNTPFAQPTSTPPPPTVIPTPKPPPTGVPPTAVPPTAVPPTAVLPSVPPASTTPIVKATSTFYFPPTWTLTPTP